MTNSHYQMYSYPIHLTMNKRL